MRKVLFILCAVLVSGCAVSTNLNFDREVEKYFADFRDYGLYISPDPCPDDFRPIGTFTIKVTPAQEEITRENENQGRRFNDGIYKKTYVNGAPIRLEVITYSQLLGIAVADAIEKKADGIANLKIRDIYNGALFDHYEISGLYIEKR